MARRPIGKGHIEAHSFGTESSKISSLSSAYPLRLIAPRQPPNSSAALVYILSYGGGLVAGDETSIQIYVGANARLGLLTQGSTKIYKTEASNVTTKQTLTVTIQDGGALVLLPDHVQPFEDSLYEQRQIFELNPTRSSLLLLDWISEGRTGRDVAWNFASWRGLNELWTLPDCTADPKPADRRLLLRDNLKLSRGSAPDKKNLQDRMDGLGVFGTLVIAGPLFKTIGDFFLETYATRPRIGEKFWSGSGAPPLKTTAKIDPSLTWAANSIRGVVVVRFGASAADHIRAWLREMLTLEGTVEREFGRRFLLCLQDR